MSDNPDMPKVICCDRMASALQNECREHAGRPFDCPDMLLHYNGMFDEYGLIIHDGTESSVLINFCPFCGTRLPSSRRDEWFDRMEEAGHDDPREVAPEDRPAAIRHPGWWVHDAERPNTSDGDRGALR